MDKRPNHAWRILAYAFLVLWLARTPRMLWKEFQRLELRRAHALSEEERAFFFLKKRLPGRLERDYFELLHAALPYVETGRIPFWIEADHSLTPLARGIVEEGYSLYWLIPSHRAPSRRQAKIRLFYRTDPPPGEGEVLERIEGTPPSCIVASRKARLTHRGTSVP
ncbi:MAG: hypothetical protein V1918_03860 [Planctomycetota bacterium]